MASSSHGISYQAKKEIRKNAETPVMPVIFQHIFLITSIAKICYNLQAE